MLSKMMMMKAKGYRQPHKNRNPPPITIDMTWKTLWIRDALNQETCPGRTKTLKD